MSPVAQWMVRLETEGLGPIGTLDFKGAYPGTPLEALEAAIAYAEERFGVKNENIVGASLEPFLVSG